MCGFCNSDSVQNDLKKKSYNFKNLKNGVKEYKDQISQETLHTLLIQHTGVWFHR